MLKLKGVKCLKELIFFLSNSLFLFYYAVQTVHPSLVPIIYQLYYSMMFQAFNSHLPPVSAETSDVNGL